MSISSRRAPWEIAQLKAVSYRGAGESGAAATGRRSAELFIAGILPSLGKARLSDRNRLLADRLLEYALPATRRRRCLRAVRRRPRPALVPPSEGQRRRRIRGGGLEADVTFAEAMADARADIDAAYHAKYDRYGLTIVGHVTDAEAVTIRLIWSDSECAHVLAFGRGPS